MADKKEEKKEEKKPSPAGPELIALYWIIGIIIFLSFFLNNFDGKFFSLSPQPVEDAETGRVVGVDDSIKFPSGDIQIGDTVILKADSFVRSAPAQSLLGKQKKYTTAMVQEGPLMAFNQQWWRLNFSDAPDGWVPEYAFTRNVSSYKTLHFVPITWKYAKPFLWVLSIIFLVLWIAAKLRYGALMKAGAEKLKSPRKAFEDTPLRSSNHIVVGDAEHQEIITAGDRRANERWMHIVQLLQSHNQNDWRQAIIEADIILEEMLEKMGYDGVTIGDKLKNVEPSDFLTLNQAWEAHKVRNRIAHMGMEFKVSHAEAEKVINLYQEVFDEFYYI
jgi:hypothetical protein